MGNQYLDAAKAFYDQHFDHVFSFLLGKTPNREVAKDLTQDVFFKVFQNWDKIDQSSAPKAYLFTLARNVLIDYYREQSKAKLLDLSSLWADQEVWTDEDDHTHQQEKLSHLKKAIEELPIQRREIIKLKKLEGLTTEEIAGKLSISKRTVENQLYRAMKTLRSKLVHFLFLFF